MKPWKPTELQKQLIFESATRGFSHWRNLWKEARKTADFEVEYPFWVVDPAKPSSDRSAVVVTRIPKAVFVDVPNVGVALDAIEKHRQEHIWNMIVLAAESSRYNP